MTKGLATLLGLGVACAAQVAAQVAEVESTGPAEAPEAGAPIEGPDDAVLALEVDTSQLAVTSLPGGAFFGPVSSEAGDGNDLGD